MDRDATGWVVKLAIASGLLLGSWMTAHADDAELIAQAVLALPEPLRADAAVVRFVDGEQEFLREGSNGMYCRADDPDTAGINVWCYPESHNAYATRWFELAASGMPASDVDEQVVAEIEDGSLEWPDYAVNYNLRGARLDTATLNTVVYLPYARGEEAGMTESVQHDRPWLMYAGTAFAHVMIPGQ